MAYRFLWVLLAGSLLLACKKDKTTMEPATPPVIVTGVLLKDIIIDHLPSPYYHFEYNTDGKVIHTSIASGLETTNIVYEGDRISEVRSASVLDANHLKYLYNFQGQPNVINYVDPNGITQKRVVLDYDGPRLVNLERQVNIGTSFITDKVMEFEYYPDGNLSRLIHHFTIPGTPAINYTDRFEQYDDKINVDGFGLLHDEFFDHLFLLPGIQLQKNNPVKEIRTGDGQNYEATYNYTYNDKKAPVNKTGTLVYTSGPEVGRSFPLNSVFSYY